MTDSLPRFDALQKARSEYSERVFSYEGRSDCARPIVSALRHLGRLDAVLSRLNLVRVPERSTEQGALRALARLGARRFDEVLDRAFARRAPLQARVCDLAAVPGDVSAGLACGLVGVGVVYVFGPDGEYGPVSLANAVRSWSVD